MESIISVTIMQTHVFYEQEEASNVAAQEFCTIIKNRIPR